MSNTVIKVEGLSKRYIIGHQEQGRYLTMRDTVAIGAKRFGKRLLHPLMASSGQPLLGVDKSEEFWALKDISFEVKQGDRIGIIGRNGAGKSTLLKILSRITEPTKGCAKIKGRVSSLLEVGTGFHPELTGRENIFLNGAVLGMSRQDIKKKFDEIVAFSEVEKFLDTPVKRYSSGMYVRLAFAVAAHLEPEILIVDEVLAVGDAQFQKKCLGKMEEVGNEGRTVLFVSHNMTAVQSLCKKALLLNNGRIIDMGTAYDVVGHYLSSSKKEQRPLYKFASNKNRKGNIRKISIYNLKNELSSLIDINESFTIKVEYVLNETLKDSTVGIQIFSEQTNLCLMSLPDTEKDRKLLEKRIPGIYMGTVKIPSDILNTGLYRLRIGIVQLSEIIDVQDNLYFEIIDKKGAVQHLGRQRKNSLLSLSLPWAIKYSDSEL
jgi:lipopolysaccharide transport system ATP-binding protein